MIMDKVKAKKTVTLTCTSCGNSFEKDYYNWKQRTSWGATNFYCRKPQCSGRSFSAFGKKDN